MTYSKLAASTIHVVDSHTGGEPTRIVIAGGPPLGPGSASTQLIEFQKFHDKFRSAIVNEPRGSDVLVGALLIPPADLSCVTGVIFFNNVGYLGMCGHGTIGLVVTLAYLGRIEAGEHRLETPVGVVTATLHSDGRVSVNNVPSYRREATFAADVPLLGLVSGEVAWGGNWFFLLEEPSIELDVSNVKLLSDKALMIRKAVNSQGYPEVDHIELFGPGKSGGDSRNFVLCPGGAYDRSPCGTGTSAKLACLAAAGKLEEGSIWRQESILGSTFEAHYRWLDRARGLVSPVITGTAFVTAESQIRLDPADPFCWGIPEF